MDFSNNAFQPCAPKSKLSKDTISHANLIAACQWGWSRSPDPNASGISSASLASRTVSSSSPGNVRAKRFAPCQGRLYHQLLCSHRVRTDLVEDCGVNCVEAFGTAGTAFMCNECLQAEATEVWEARKAQHISTYPPIPQMSKEQYIQYYEERRQLEAEFVREHNVYEMELKTKVRPSNVCSTLEASKEDVEFVTELDSLSLSLMASNASTGDKAQLQIPSRDRSSLPNDASEQLHWNLNTLALDRGSCSIEYLTPSSTAGVSPLHQMSEEELWKKPRS